MSNYINVYRLAHDRAIEDNPTDPSEVLAKFMHFVKGWESEGLQDSTYTRLTANNFRAIFDRYTFHAENLLEYDYVYASVDGGLLLQCREGLHQWFLSFDSDKNTYTVEAAGIFRDFDAFNKAFEYFRSITPAETFKFRYVKGVTYE